MILESAEPREVHHFATILGYGACAINPYLAHSTIKELIGQNLLDKDYYAAVDDYDAAVLHGIVKITSKMGISTIQSYQGSKILKPLVFQRMLSRNTLLTLYAVQEILHLRILKNRSIHFIQQHLIRSVLKRI